MIRPRLCLPRLGLSLVSLLLLSSAALAQLRQNPLPTDQELARYGLVRAWWNRAVIDPARDKVRSISNDEQVVFVQSTAGVVTAFDAESGRAMWSRLVGSPTQVAYPVVSNDDMAFVASGMRLHGIHKASGEELWEIALPHHPSASPEVDEDQIYIGTVDGSVYAFDLKKITKLYQDRLLPQYSHQTEVWRYQAPSEIVAPPVSNGEVVVFASYSGLLFSVAARDRGTNFQFETDGRTPIRVPVARSYNTIYVASDDARVFALDIRSGHRRWSFTAGSPIRVPPRVVGSQVFVTPSRRGMFCLRNNTGFEVWHQPKATDFLAASPDLVYGTNDLGDVLILNRKDGSIMGELPFRNLGVHVHNERTDRLYLATQSGFVACIREKSREQPLWHMFPERQPIQPRLAPDEPETPATEPAPPSDGITPGALN